MFKLLCTVFIVREQNPKLSPNYSLLVNTFKSFFLLLPFGYIYFTHTTSLLTLHFWKVMVLLLEYISSVHFPPLLFQM